MYLAYKNCVFIKQINIKHISFNTDKKLILVMKAQNTVFSLPDDASLKQ